MMVVASEEEREKCLRRGKKGISLLSLMFYFMKNEGKC